MELGPNTRYILDNINMKCSYKAISVDLIEFSMICCISKLLNPNCYEVLNNSFKDYDVEMNNNLVRVYLSEQAGYTLTSRFRMFGLLNNNCHDLVSVIRFAKYKHSEVFDKFNNHPTSKIICSMVSDDLNSIINLMNDFRDNNC